MNHWLDYLNRHSTFWLMEQVWPMVWQSSILILLVAVASRTILRKSPAQLRYGLWCLVLLRLMAPPTLDLPTSLAHWVASAMQRHAPMLPQAERLQPAVSEFMQQPIAWQEEAPPRPAPAIAPAPPKPSPTITTSTAVLLLWMAITALLTLLLAVRVAWFHRIIRNATPAPEPVLQLLDALRAQMRLRRPVVALMTEDDLSPAVYGIFRPRVLLPRTVIEGLSGEQLSAVIVHELAHVKRGDTWVNWLQLLLGIVYFFHPLVWYANRKMRMEREQACDDLTLVTLGLNRDGYAQSLVSVAERVSVAALFTPAQVGVVETKIHLARRLRRILNDRLRPVPRLTWFGAAIVLAFAALFGTWHSTQAAPGTSEKPLEGLVQTADGTPVTQADVFLATPSQGVNIEQGRAWKSTRPVAVTDVTGHFHFPPQDSNYTLVIADDRGYAEITMADFGKSRSITLQPWGRVEGVLMIDAKPGAEQPVSLSYDRNYELEAVKIYFIYRASSGKDGRFSFERAVPGAANVWRGVHAAGEMLYSIGLPVEVPAGGQASVTLDVTGRMVKGRLAAPAGYNAKIPWNAGQYHVSLKLPDLPRPDKFDAMSRDQRTAWYDAWWKSEEGKAYKARCRTYAMVVKEGGDFTIDYVPAGEYRLWGQVFEPPQDSSVGLGETIGTVRQEFTVPEIPGSLSDEALDLGTILLEIEKRPKEGEAVAGNEGETQDGEIETPSADVTPADEAGKPLDGVVRTPDGTPVAQATVVVATWNQGVIIEQGRVPNGGGARTVTDATGHFQLPPQEGNYALVIAEDRGYAEVSKDDFEKSKDITLQPWGRVEGVLMIGAKPGVEQPVILGIEQMSGPKEPSLSYYNQTTTGKDGHFVFDRAKPGTVQASRRIRISNDNLATSHSIPIEVPAGGGVSVTIGGTGRPVTGRVIVPDGFDGKLDRNTGVYSVSLKLPDPPLPDNYNAMSEEQKTAWPAAWRKSEEGRAYQAQRRSYGGPIQEDGRFSIDDVPAGDYTLSAQVYEPSQDGAGARGKRICGSIHDFTVPEMPGGRSDEPLDLGAIPLNIVKQPTEGEAVSEREDETPQTAIEMRPLDIRVVDESGVPVEGVSVLPHRLRTKSAPKILYTWGEKVHGKAQEVRTNARGTAQIQYPRYAIERWETSAVSVTVSGLGHVPREAEVNVDGFSPPIRLEQAATVRVSGYVGAKENIAWPVRALTETPSTVKDEKGWIPAADGEKWMENCAVSSEKHLVWLVHRSETQGLLFSKVEEVIAEKGKTIERSFALEPGCRLEGRLDDSVPRPITNGIAEAHVMPNEVFSNSRTDRVWTTWIAQAPIRDDGSFVFESLPHGRAEVGAFCDGAVTAYDNTGKEPKRGWTFPTSTAGALVTGVVVAMEPTATAVIHVEDPDGRPLASTRVSFLPQYSDGTLAKPGCSTTAQELQLSPETREEKPDDGFAAAFQVTTGETGKAVVKNLAAGTSEFVVGHDGFDMPIQQREGNPPRRFVKIALKPGKTTEMTVRMERKGTSVLGDTDTAKAPDSPPEYGAALQGTVQDASGKPVSHTVVYLATPTRQVTYRNGLLKGDGKREDFMATDAEGHFVLPPQREVYLLVVATDEGFAEAGQMAFEKSPVLTLQPWGRVEGVLKIGDHLAPNLSVSLYYNSGYGQEVPGVFAMHDTRTYSDGSFVFKRVIPGGVRVGRTFRRGEGDASSVSRFLQMEPGKTSRVTLGGTGRPVTGHILPPEELKEKVDWSLGMYFLSNRSEENPRLPKNWEMMSPKERQAWYEKYQASDEYKTWQQSERTYSFAVDEQGNFRIEDVESGKYSLRALLRRPSQQGPNDSEEIIADGKMDVEVPAIDTPRSDVAFELPPLQPKAIPKSPEAESTADTAGAQPAQNATDSPPETGAGLEGTVQDSSGKPVSNTEVHCATPTHTVGFRYGRIESGVRREDRIVTDADGHFVLPPQPEVYLLIVATDAGFAAVDQADFEKAPIVTLQPWGRVEGVVKIGAKPAADQPVTLSYARYSFMRAAPQFRIYYDARTNSDGAFVFERVVTGRLSVCRGIELTQGAVAPSHGQFVEVAPGSTARVGIGGTGRPVIGRILLPEGLKEKVNWSFGGYSLASSWEGPQWPENWEEMTADEKQAWQDAHQNTDEYKAWERALQPYMFVPDEEGGFRIDDVESGKYTLRVSIRASLPGNPNCPGDTIAGGKMDVEVSAMDVPRSDDPLMLPPLQIKVYPKPLEAGTIAPPFTVEGLNGGTVKLEDYKGKFVLLAFWAIGHKVSPPEIPQLQAAFEKFKDNPRFAMIGLSLDKDKSAAQQYVEKNRIGWVQGFLGDWVNTDLPKQYGIRGIPAMLLIDPDGKVASANLWGEDIEQAVARALQGTAQQSKEGEATPGKVYYPNPARPGQAPLVQVTPEKHPYLVYFKSGLTQPADSVREVEPYYMIGVGDREFAVRKDKVRKVKEGKAEDPKEPR